MFVLLAWANPTGGQSMDEKGPKYWRYVYPVGALFIMAGFYLAGRKQSKKTEKPTKKTNSYDLV